MSEFNFKSQVCTDKNQSERLLALGLKPETADMCYKVTTHDWRGHEIPEKDKHYSLCSWYDELNIVCGFEQVKTIPAWSLHRLIEMIQDAIVNKDGTDDNLMLDISGIGLYDGTIDAIAELIKKGYFNKEYFEE